MRSIDKNKRFYQLLHAVKDESGKRPRWTTEKIAAEILCSRPRLVDALNNRTGRSRGSQIRPRLVKFFKEHFESNWKELIDALGWDENGEIVPSVTFHEEQKEADHGANQ